jgi:hypothetical protein
VLDPGAGFGIGLGHDAQVFLQLRLADRTAHDVQPVGDQRILGLQKRQPQLVGVALGQIDGLGLRLDQRGEVRPLRRIGGKPTPARQAESFNSARPL